MYHQSQKTKLRSILLAVSFLAFSGLSMVHAQPWEQTHKLLAANGRVNDNFGNSVAVSGNLAVIGANNDANNNGFAYVFDITKSQQLFKFAADGGSGNNFGVSVAINGNLAVIGDSRDRDNGTSSGSAYVFDVTTGNQLFKLLPLDGAAGDNFGNSVAISGNLAVIGAFGDDSNSFDTGSAYVFDISTNQQLFKLFAADEAGFDKFGTSVAVSGNFAVIGVPFDDDNGTDSGSAYVFDVTTGQQIFKLLASDGTANDQFGNSVAMSGNLVVIGTIFGNGNVNDSGAAYVFDVTTGDQLFKLLPSDDGVIGERFGTSVTIDGNIAVIGAEFDDDNGTRSGSAYVFDVTTGQQLFKLLPSDGAEFDQFGNSVAISGNLAVIGAMFDDDRGQDSGSAYVFQQRTTNVLTISPDPLIAQQDGTFSIVNTFPNQQTWLIYSLDGLQQQFIRKLNVVIDLANPKIAVGPRLTDANGDLQIVITMPGIINPIDVWFQAVQHNNVTNFVATQLIP